MALIFLRGDKNVGKREISKLEQQLPQFRRSQEIFDDHEDWNSSSSRRCDLFEGSWVFDNVSYPLYEERECSFMLEEHACAKFGRKDVQFQKYRWQPRHCDLPRFNGTALLEKLRGKRMVFVGDSLNRNQWASMLCLIESSLNQSSKKSTITKGNTFIFEAIEYNATIEFYWSPFLVESNCDDPFHHSNFRNRMIMLSTIEKHARQWGDADLLVFNSFAWWLEPKYMANLVDANSKTRVYEMALSTWSRWLEINIDRNKAKLFFMGPSPLHAFRDERVEIMPICHNKSEPILDEGERGIGIDGDMVRVANSAVLELKKSGLKIEYLNITHMSHYRLDAHPSIYRKFLRPLTRN